MPKISALSQATSVSPTDEIAVVQGGVTKRAAASLVRAYGITAAEISASVTPTNYAYPPGHAYRYGAVGNGVTSDQTALQNAINVAHASAVECYIPAGVFLVTGLTLPGTSTAPDERGKVLHLRGAGCGEPFMVNEGTTIRSVTNAPVLADLLSGAQTSNGTVHISGIYFDGNSTTAVVSLQSFYGISTIKDCVIYQNGTGAGSHGLEILWGATWTVENCYALNADCVAINLFSARTGDGFRYIPSGNVGLATFRKCTSRGFKNGFVIGGGDGAAFSPSLYDCECSTNYNGILLYGCYNAKVIGCYFEGGERGTGILDESYYTVIRDNQFFHEYSTHIDVSKVATFGSLVTGNFISMNDFANSVGISVYSSGYHRSVCDNYISHVDGTAGVKGIKITGASPAVDIHGNGFSPTTAWTGSGSKKVSDESTGAIAGFVQWESGDREATKLSQGSVSLAKNSLTQTAVAANTLTLGTGTYYVLTCAGATTINALAPMEEGKVYIIRTVGTNATFADTATLSLAGGASFSVNGTIGFICDGTVAYELFRATHA